MKKLLFATCCLFTLIVNAQTPEEIADNFTKAMGGLDLYMKPANVKFTGVVNAQGMDFPITLQIVNNKSMRADIDVMGQKIVNVYNEGKGWKIDPFNGAADATDVEGAELAGFKSQATLASGLMNFRNLGNTLALAGNETTDGTKHYILKMTSKEDGKTVTFYINSNTWGLLKVVSSREIQGQDTEIETLFSDMKEFGGMKFYMTRTQQAMGQVFQTLNFTNIEFNVTIDPKVFDK